MSMKRKLGISLIVLVLSIIVIVILATAVILSVANNNPIDNAKEANKVSEISSVKEQAVLDILNWQTKKSINGEDITVNTPEKVQEILNEVNTEENKYYVGFSDTGIITPNGYEVPYEELYSTEAVKEVIISKTTEELVVGDKVYYDTGNTSVGNEGIIECTVLYDKTYNEINGTNYGVQIISTDVLKDSNGNTIKHGIGSGTGFDIKKNAYNNALNTLYTEVQKYLNQTYASSVRCIGSDPAEPMWDTSTNQAGYYTKEIAEADSKYYSYMDSYYGKLKNMDGKYNTDLNQINTIGNINITTDSYWLASRNINAVSANCQFGIRYVNSSGNSYSKYLCTLYSNGTKGSSSDSKGLRPVFNLNNNVIANKVQDSDMPYTLEIKED